MRKKHFKITYNECNQSIKRRNCSHKAEIRGFYEIKRKKEEEGREEGK